MVTNTGAEYLSRITNLSSLNLDDTEVTDAGLKHLAKLLHLRYLSLNKVTVTLEAAQELKKALPDCGVYLGGTSVK